MALCALGVLGPASLIAQQIPQLNCVTRDTEGVSLGLDHAGMSQQHSEIPASQECDT